MKEGFHKYPYKHTLFVKVRDGEKMLIICLYIDDLIFTENGSVMFEEFKNDG